MSRLLVTGALGHIGSRFIREISPDSLERVLLLDNLSTQRYAALFDLPRNVPCQFIEDDVCTGRLERYFDGVDMVIHLAAVTDAEGSFAVAEEVERVNVKGTQRVAEACAAYGCKLLFLSTTSVYGPRSDIVDEDCSTQDLRPQSPYAESKLRAEQLLRQLGEDEGLSYVICLSVNGSGFAGAQVAVHHRQSQRGVGVYLLCPGRYP